MIRVVLASLCLLALPACVSIRSNHGYALERGQTELTGEVNLDSKESILAKFGEPSMIGTFDRNAWYYLNSTDETRAFFKPKTKQRVVVAFHFDNDGVLSEVDNFNLADGQHIRLVSRETPTRGRELNFWEQLLGNVGRLPANLGENQVPGQQ